MLARQLESARFDMHLSVRTDETDVEVEQIFMILSNRRRRFALHILKRDGEDVPIGALAEEIAAWEHEVPVQEVTEQMRKNVYTALRQTHLRKMDEVGIVAFQKDRGVVRPEAVVDEIDVSYAVPRRTLPWSMQYLGLATGAGLFILLAYVGVWPFSAAPFAWATAFVAAFLISAILHYRSRMQLGGQALPPEVAIRN